MFFRSLCAFGHVNQTAESRHIAGGDVGQIFAVEPYPGLFKAGHKGRIIQAELPDAGRYACNPEAPKFPLFIAPITIGICHAFMNGFQSRTIQPGTAAVIPAGFIQDLFVTSVGGNIILGTWHFINTPVGLYEFGISRPIFWASTLLTSACLRRFLFRLALFFVRIWV
jgi:hypothetical protein